MTSIRTRSNICTVIAVTGHVPNLPMEVGVYTAPRPAATSQNAIVASSWLPTLREHWLTAGVVFAVSSSAASSVALKFETPIARVLPA